MSVMRYYLSCAWHQEWPRCCGGRQESKGEWAADTNGAVLHKRGSRRKKGMSWKKSNKQLLAWRLSNYCVEPINAVMYQGAEWHSRADPRDHYSSDSISAKLSMSPSEARAVPLKVDQNVPKERICRIMHAAYLGIALFCVQQLWL